VKTKIEEYLPHYHLLLIIDRSYRNSHFPTWPDSFGRDQRKKYGEKFTVK